MFKYLKKLSLWLKSDFEDDTLKIIPNTEPLITNLEIYTPNWMIQLFKEFKSND